ncbi:MAG TPA: SDR family oxidoreductase [Ilumatobacteraceae bacterium]|nr:SDR family oxidoreductase [Ilumatobacteraceae bacterium]
MDLGIAGRRAIVCASSQGLGRACAEALSAEGVDVVLNGRDADKLALAAAEIRALGAGDVSVVAADITTDDGRDALLAACPEPDIVVLNNRGPKPGSIDEITDDDLQVALDLHFWTPIKIVQRVVPGMCERGFGRIVSITSAMVTTPRPSMLASTGARTGATAMLKAVSRDVARYNVTINCLLPERIDSPRQHQMANLAVERDGITYDEARAQMADSIAAKRLGRTSEFGATCAFLCSVHAGFISGNNLHLDGGSYPGLV